MLDTKGSNYMPHSGSRSNINHVQLFLALGYDNCQACRGPTHRKRLSTRMFFLLAPVAQALPLIFVSKGPIKSSIESQPLEKIEMSLVTPTQEAPILPIIPWGLRFDEDLIALDDLIGA